MSNSRGYNRKSKSISAEEQILLDSIKRGIDNGLSWKQIATSLGVGEMKVRYRCEKYGWESDFARRQRVNKTLATFGQKECSKCSRTFMIEEFDLDPRAKDGRSSECVHCRRPVILKAWRDRYADPVQRLTMLASTQRWREKNREHTREYARMYGRNHSEGRKAYLREWFKRNPGKYAFYRRLREARERGAEGFFTQSQLLARIEYYGGRCYICGCDWYTLPPNDQTIDHVKPINKGGSNWPANLRPACRSCNSTKRDQWPWPRLNS